MKKIVERGWALKSKLGGFVGVRYPDRDCTAIFDTKKQATTAGNTLEPKAIAVKVEIREL
jgi:hypothetical protein